LAINTVKSNGTGYRRNEYGQKSLYELIGYNHKTEKQARISAKNFLGS